MSYKITRSVVHNTEHNVHKFVDWILYDISFTNDIQPLYPNLSENDFYTIINDFSYLIEPLSSWENLFTGSAGYISYSYTFNGIPEYPGVTDYTQNIVFSDSASYAAWQLQENTQSQTRVSGWQLPLEEKIIDYSNMRLEGIQLINNLTGETTNLSVVKYLSSKYFILRQTLVSVVHTIE
jgi:hypothetical protein